MIWVIHPQISRAMYPDHENQRLRGPSAPTFTPLSPHCSHTHRRSPPRRRGPGHPRGLHPECRGARAPQAAAQALGERVAARVLQLAPSAPLAPTQVPVGCEVRLVALPGAQASPKVPRPLRTLASNALALFAEPFAVQTEIELGSLRLFGVPAEVVGDLRAPGDAILVTLADGYEGYVEASDRWSKGAGESKTTYYGPDLARAFQLVPGN